MGYFIVAHQNYSFPGLPTDRREGDLRVGQGEVIVAVGGDPHGDVGDFHNVAALRENAISATRKNGLIREGTSCCN